MSIFYLVLAILVTYRISALIAEDTIAEPLREFWQARFPTSDYYYNAHKVINRNATGVLGQAKAWPFKRDVMLDSDFGWIPAKTYKLGELIECFYCVSVWAALAVVVTVYGYNDLPYTLRTFLDFMAVAAGAEIVKNVAGR